MIKNLKIYLLLALLGAAAFGVFVVSQLPKDTKIEAGDSPNGTGTTSTGAPKKLIEYDVKTLYFDPANERAIHREYPQFYERGETKVWFWFTNPNPTPIKISFQNTSCSACNFAEIAVVEKPKIDSDEPNPFGALFGGAGPTPMDLDVLGLRERNRMVAAVPPENWKGMTAHDKTHVEFPAAKSPTEPTHGILRLKIRVEANKQYKATMGLQLPDMPQPALIEFLASVTLAPICEITPTSIDFRDIADGESSPERPIYFWSSIRTVDGPPESRLYSPTGQTRSDPHLAFSEPIRLSELELAELTEKISTERKAPYRITGAYKVNVSLLRKASDPANPGQIKELDIGATERIAEFVPSGGAQPDVVPKLTVKANILGAVALEDGDKIDLGSFPAKVGVEKTVRIVSDRNDLELEVVKAEPGIITLSPLSARMTQNNRSVWSFTVKIDPNLGGGTLKPTSVVILKIKGTGQLVRIPIAGKGTN